MYSTNSSIATSNGFGVILKMAAGGVLTANRVVTLSADDAAYTITLSGGNMSFAGGFSTGFTTAVPLGGSGSNLQIGYLSGTVTSTTDAFVTWASGSGTALNPSTTNGSLVLAARNTAGAEVVLAAGNSAIIRVNSSGMNGVLGQTTPAAASVTTLGASGLITSTAVNTIFSDTVATTSYKAFQLSNTGNAGTYFGIDGSATSFGTGTAYAALVYTPTRFEVNINGTPIQATTSTGVSVTGTGYFSAQGDTLTLGSAATNVAQLNFGTVKYGTVGTAYSTAALCVTANAYQTAAGTDSWTQTSANPSLRFKSAFGSDAWYWQRSPSGTAVGNDATFWATTVMTLSGAGALTITDNYNIALGKKLIYAANAYLTPEDNVTGAVVSGTSNVNIKAGGAVVAGFTATGLSVTGTTTTYNGAGYGGFYSNGTSGGAYNIMVAGVLYGQFYGNATNTVIDSAGSPNLIFQTAGVTRGTFTSGGLVVTGSGTFNDANGRITITSTTGTNNSLILFNNTGGGYYIGPDNSAGAGLGTGVPYAFTTYVPAGRVINTYIAGTGTITTISATAVSVSVPINISNASSLYDSLTIAGSSSNSLGLRMQNSYAGSNNWNLYVSGGGPSANGSCGFYDDTRGGWAMYLTKTTNQLNVKGGGVFGDGSAASNITVNALGTAGNMPWMRFQIGGVQQGILGSSGAILGTAATDIALFAETGKAIYLFPNGQTSDGLIVTTSGALTTVHDYPAVNVSGTNYMQTMQLNGYAMPINTGVIESGYRIGLSMQTFISDANFKGRLANQWGIWCRHGSYNATAGSIIDLSYGIYIEMLTTGNTTISSSYGIYQVGATKNYFEGSGQFGVNTQGGVKLVASNAANGAQVASGTTQTYGALRLGNAATGGILDFGQNGATSWIQSTNSGDLSQTYTISLNPNGGAIQVGSYQAIDSTYFGYSGTYRVLRFGTNATQRSLALCIDPVTVTGGSFTGTGQILIPNNAILAPNAAGTDWAGVIRGTAGTVVIGPVLTSGELAGGATGTMTMSNTALTVTGSLYTNTSLGVYANGASNDPYGAISVTQPNSANYSYYGFTRQSVLGVGMGIDTSNQFWMGTITGSGASAVKSVAWWTATGSAFTVPGTIAGTNITSGGNVTGSSASCTGNAATATTASACSGNAATATQATTYLTGAIRSLTAGGTGSGIYYDGSATASRVFLGMGAGTDTTFRMYGAALAADVMSVNLSTGVFSFSASLDVVTSYKVGGTKVVGAQGAALSTVSNSGNYAADGANIATAINGLIARLQAHGLIA